MRMPSSTPASGHTAATGPTATTRVPRGWRRGSPPTSWTSTAPPPSPAAGSSAPGGCSSRWSAGRSTAGSHSTRATSPTQGVTARAPPSSPSSPPRSAGISTSRIWRCSASRCRALHSWRRPGSRTACAASTRRPRRRSRARRRSRSRAPGRAASSSAPARRCRTTSARRSGATGSPNSPSATAAATCSASVGPSTAPSTSGAGAGPRRRSCWRDRSRRSAARGRRTHPARWRSSRSSGGDRAGRPTPSGCWTVRARHEARSCAARGSPSMLAIRAPRSSWSSACGDRIQGPDQAPLLELLVRAAIAAGELDRAATALAELRVLAQLVGTGPLQAAADFVDGMLTAAREEHERARTLLEDAVDGYQRNGAPYEAAQARVELAATLTALGRTDRADAETATAVQALRALGAVSPLRAPRSHTAGARGPRPAGRGPDEPRDRRPPRRQRAHGPPPRHEHPPQARRAVPGGSRGARRPRRHLARSGHPIP